MAAIPQPAAHTVLAIFRAYEESRDSYESWGLSVGEMGTECDRALWYSLHWLSAPEVIEGRKISIFTTGDMWEERIVADLRAIGVDVYGQQDRIRLVGGHVRGKRDGAGVGLPEAPITEHLFEFKSSNAKGFREIVKKKCKEAKPLHYAQCQLGMNAFGLTRCGYLVVNKDDDDRYFERIEYDADFCLRLLARAERIIRAGDPPARISDDPEFFGCRFCKHKAVCHAGAWPRVTCRSCLHSTAELHGDAEWSCARWAKPLSIDEQRQACPAHLFVPALVPGTQTDVDEENELVTYRLRDGRIWVDGAGEQKEIAA